MESMHSILVSISLKNLNSHLYSVDKDEIENIILSLWNWNTRMVFHIIYIMIFSLALAYLLRNAYQTQSLTGSLIFNMWAFWPTLAQPKLK